MNLSPIIRQRKQEYSQIPFTAAIIETPIGSLFAVSDSSNLYRLEFIDKKEFKEIVQGLERYMGASIVTGYSKPLQMIEHELRLYFLGNLEQFRTPLRFTGTSFQNKVWEALLHIPFGETRSYLDVAIAVNNPKGFRAVAQANGANRFVIVVPCHRIINSNGQMGGYSAGLNRKEWLLNHEQKRLS